MRWGLFCCPSLWLPPSPGRTLLCWTCTAVSQLIVSADWDCQRRCPALAVTWKSCRFVARARTLQEVYISGWLAQYGVEGAWCGCAGHGGTLEANTGDGFLRAGQALCPSGRCCGQPWVLVRICAVTCCSQGRVFAELCMGSGTHELPGRSSGRFGVCCNQSVVFCCGKV